MQRSGDVSVSDLLASAKKLKRPWIKDHRGLPPAALLGSESFLHSILPCIKSLLVSDDGWDDDMTEHGYVKQKVAGSTDSNKLRGIMPNSTCLRLLTNIVLARVKPYSDRYSHEQGTDVLVLAGKKGGQPLDIVSVAQFALQCARDDGDRGAFGHFDIRNYHDSLSWTEIWRSQRRRGIPDVWSVAALRLQRCPKLALAVRSTMTRYLMRSRGAITGNALAPWFGRLLVEDAFVAVQADTDPLCYRFMDVRLKPMAWSDNVVGFAKSVPDVARLLSKIAQRLEQTHLFLKNGSLEIVPASTRRSQWHAIKEGPYTFDVVDESKILGYHVACNGDTSRSRATLTGALRGSAATLDRKFSLATPTLRGNWWKQQFRGLVAYFAAFLGLTSTILRQMETISNLGARRIACLRRGYNVHERLTSIKSQHKCHVDLFYVQTVVKWVGHCFRHPLHPISQLLSLPLDGRLNDLRSSGTETPVSNASDWAWRALRAVGLDVDFPVSGRPAVRGASGFVFRWGEGWFGPIRDGGVGWHFERTAKLEVDRRVQILLRLFSKSGGSQLSLANGALALTNE